MKDENQLAKRNRKPNGKKHNQDSNDFFDNSIKSRNQPEGISGFSKSKTDSKEISKQKSQEDEKMGFDTFKSPN